MTVAPLFAQVLPPAPSPARPAQGDGPSDLAGLFALLLAGMPGQGVVAQGADTGVTAGQGLTRVPVVDFRPAVPATPSTGQPNAVFGGVGAAADPLQPASPLPATTAAPLPAAFTPVSAQPQFAPASPDASLPGLVSAPNAESTRSAPYPSLVQPGHVRTQTPGAAAPPPLAAVAPLGAAQTETARAARLEVASVVLTADPTSPTAPSGMLIQAGADPEGPSPAAPRVRSLAAPGVRSAATPAPEARRPHFSILAPTGGSPADQPAAGDQAWLEPSSDAANGAVTRADHALPDPARALAHARQVAPAPVFQIGVQIAKAVPSRIDRLVVQLEPAALGRVEVRLKFHRNDQVSAVIAAERPDTLDALQRDARLLERSLHQAGLRLDSDGLTFSLKREQTHHQAHDENWFAPSAGERADQPLLPARDQPPSVHWLRGLRALDIRV
jgi:hypothetical protein